MVRSFGLLLLIGIAIAFLLALTVGFSALSLRPKAAPRKRLRPPGRVLGWLRDWTLWLALEHPLRVIGVGLALALVGWGLGTQIETVSDIRSLAPQSLPAGRNLN
jgi:uncharacterized protein